MRAVLEWGINHPTLDVLHHSGFDLSVWGVLCLYVAGSAIFPNKEFHLHTGFDSRQIHFSPLTAGEVHSGRDLSQELLAEGERFEPAYQATTQGIRSLAKKRIYAACRGTVKLRSERGLIHGPGIYTFEQSSHTTDRSLRRSPYWRQGPICRRGRKQWLVVVQLNNRTIPQNAALSVAIRKLTWRSNAMDPFNSVWRV